MEPSDLEAPCEAGVFVSYELGWGATITRVVKPFSSPLTSGRRCFSPPCCVDTVLCRACWSLLHPWIVRRVGVHGRATVIDGFGAQFVVPGFVAVDLA
jgi:hypothetical protein